MFVHNGGQARGFLGSLVGNPKGRHVEIVECWPLKSDSKMPEIHQLSWL